jgi:membrane protein insertase Oxa1/YidC/SpoIIIJ
MYQFGAKFYDRTIAKIGDAEFTAEQFFIAFGEFAKIFFGSLGIGAGIALLMALVRCLISLRRYSLTGFP